MPNTYAMQLTYSFSLLNGQPDIDLGSYVGWFTYVSDTIDGTFPNQYGQIAGTLYLAPAFYPTTVNNVGQIVSLQPASLVVGPSGNVVSFQGSFGRSALSVNLSATSFNFGYGNTLPLSGSGTVSCANPILAS